MSVQAAKLRRAARLSILLNAFMAVLKIAGGLLSGSISLLGDGLHSIFDSFSSVAVYAGIRLSERPPDERHPYGYFKAETLAALLVTGVLLLAGAGIAREALRNLKAESVPEAIPVLMGVAVASALLSEAMARYKLRVGSESNSIALLADAYHSRADVLSSGSVLFGLALANLGVHWGDAAAGVVVAAIILLTGVRLGREAADVLMDRSPGEGVLLRITEAARSSHLVKDCRVKRSRAVGNHLFVELEVDLDAGLSIESGNRIAREVEGRVKAAVPEVESTVVSLKPLGIEARRIWARSPWSRGRALGHRARKWQPIASERKAAPSKTIAVPIAGGDLEDPMERHFGRTSAFAVIDTDGARLVNVRILRNPHRSAEYGAGKLAARLVVEAGADVVIADDLGEGSAVALRESGVEAFSGVKAATVKEAVEKYLKGELRTSP